MLENFDLSKSSFFPLFSREPFNKSEKLNDGNELLKSEQPKDYKDYKYLCEVSTTGGKGSKY